MGISLVAETVTFLAALVMGAVICAVFDLFRVARLTVRPTAVSSFWQDIAFWLIAALLTYLFLLVRCDGEIRGYVLLGQAFGFVLCRLTVSTVFIRVMAAVMGAVKRFQRAISRRLLKPLGKLLRRFCRFLVHLCKKTGKILKKGVFSLKKHLKFSHQTGYNSKNIMDSTDVEQNRTENRGETLET